jgi:hypothetical protein
MATLFSKRFIKEKSLYELGSVSPLRTKDYISGNSKTGHSLNFPIINCRPTKKCSENCYACSGPISFKYSLLKALSIEESIKTNLSFAVEKTVGEIRKLGLTNLRYSGSGDLTEDGVKYIDSLSTECPDVIFWGFTRKLEIVEGLLSLNKGNVKVIFSCDDSTLLKDIVQAKQLGVKLSWLYTDKAQTMFSNHQDVLVVFANHKNGKLDESLPKVAKECPAVRDHSIGCNECQRCFNF